MIGLVCMISAWSRERYLDEAVERAHDRAAAVDQRRREPAHAADVHGGPLPARGGVERDEPPRRPIDGEHGVAAVPGAGRPLPVADGDEEVALGPHRRPARRPDPRLAGARHLVDHEVALAVEGHTDHLAVVRAAVAVEPAHRDPYASAADR